MILNRNHDRVEIFVQILQPTKEIYCYYYRYNLVRIVDLVKSQEWQDRVLVLTKEVKIKPCGNDNYAIQHSTTCFQQISPNKRTTIIIKNVLFSYTY